MNEELAEWRPNPVVERDLTEDLHREGRRRRTGWALALSTLALCPFACLGSCLSFGGPGAPWPLWPVLAISFGLFLFFAHRYAQDGEALRRRRDELGREFGDVAGWLVEMTISQGEAVTGRDVGVVWFEDDRLYFTGTRTSFGLGAGDLGNSKDADGPLDSRAHLAFPLRTDSAVKPFVVGLSFVSPQPDAGLVIVEDSFRLALRGWLASGGTARGQLPPLSLGPGLPSEASLRRRAVLATAVWPVIFVLIVGVGLESAPADVCLAALIAILMAIWPDALSPRRRWRACEDRRRLEAALRHNKPK